MDQPDSISKRRGGVWTTLAVAAVTGASAVTIALPVTLANADPVEPGPPGTTTAAPAPPPVDPNAPLVDPNAPPPADANAPPVDPNAPPVDPNAPSLLAAQRPGEVDNAAGGFSYVVPAGWVDADATRLAYGQALLSKPTGPAVIGQPPPVANDTSIILGRLDLKLFAGAEPDNAKAAVRLASDMGEFFMPYQGTRINQDKVTLNAGDMPGSASYYEVKFNDTTKPNGQIWAGVVGSTAPGAPHGQRNERWFVVWLGTANNPVDKAAAVALAQSIRPWTPPPPPEAPPPGEAPAAPPPEGAPAPGVPGAPPPENAPPGGPAPANLPAPLGVPVPVTTPVPGMEVPGMEMMPPSA